MTLAPPQDPRFDRVIDRRGTHSAKWDMMGPVYGVDPAEGIAMWVADMDFASPVPVQAAVRAMAEHGVFGYFGDDAAYKAAIRWWMQTRHGWAVEDGAIFTTHGLVNAVGLCLHTWTKPGDAVVLFTPVYHAFARVIRAAGREVVESRLVRDAAGAYVMDLDAAEAQLSGRERMVILCSPHNPGGRVWTRDELAALAGFCQRHDLMLVSDEVHHDLVFPGHRHVPMPLAAPELSDRLVMLTAASKTFNIAGAHIGNVIIPDPKLRGAFASTLGAMGISPNSFGMAMVTAAYGPEGAAWVDDLVAYLDGNRQIFDAGMAAVPGAASMALQATYLAWVDFAGTGMARDELMTRIERGARIAVNHGPTFGAGGESFLRFNLGMPRSQVTEAVSRLQAAFADLQ